MMPLLLSRRLRGLKFTISRPIKATTTADVAVGFLNGWLGGLTGLVGIVVTIWCQLRGLPKDRQRAVFQPVSLAAAVVKDEAQKGYDLMFIGLDGSVEADGGFATQISQLAAGFDGPLMVLAHTGETAGEKTALHGKSRLLVPVNGTLDLFNLPYITSDQILSQPLRDLLDRGRDSETGTAVIVLDVTLQFFGRTLSGDEIASEPATFTIEVTPCGM